MDTGVVFLFCVLYMALSHVPITNAEWRGNVCRTRKVEYLQESYCNRYIFSQCAVRKTKLTSKTVYYESCCPEWNHNGDQNCNIPICSPVCQKVRTCVAPYKCECTIDQNMACAIDNDDLGLSSSTDITEKKPPLSDAVRIPNLIKALADIALVLACLICGFIVYETRKRCYKPNRHFSTAAEVGLANTMEFNTDTDPDTNNWTTGNDSTGRSQYKSR